MGHRRARQPGERPRIDPGLPARPEVRALLARHDIGALFRVLREHGWTQSQIAEATSTPQSSVCEIVNGRRVTGFPVLVRIADGVGIPRELMRLWPDESDAYADLTELRPLGKCGNGQGADPQSCGVQGGNPGGALSSEVVQRGVERVAPYLREFPITA